MSIYKGKVYLVGAGPGDPELLTIKALNILQKADIIFYDRLINLKILEHAPSKCEKIFVGKRYKSISYTQEQINQFLYENTKQKKVVVRLKGGDPFIFGRGGEEIEFLIKNCIEVEVIPGITAAVAAAASLTMSLTHRDFGQSVMFLSGYGKKENHRKEILPDYNWDFLANDSLTLVFYMSLSNLSTIANKLIQHGKSKDTGATLISNCSMPNEKTVISTLSKVYSDSLKKKIEFPAILLVGDVIQNVSSLRQKYQTQQEDRSLQKKKDEYIYFSREKINGKLFILLFHGSRELPFSSLPGEFAEKLSQQTGGMVIKYAFLSSISPPSLEEVFESIDHSIIKEVNILPMLLLPGKHLDQDIPQKVSEMEEKYTDLKINLCSPPHIIKDILPVISNMVHKLIDK